MRLGGAASAVRAPVSSTSSPGAGGVARHAAAESRMKPRKERDTVMSRANLGVPPGSRKSSSQLRHQPFALGLETLALLGTAGFEHFQVEPRDDIGEVERMRR